MIRSVSHDQQEILRSIMTLHCPQGFDCDATFGNGAFWKEVPPPRWKFDIEPVSDGVEKACSTSLPLGEGSLSSLVLDPPFMTYVRQGRSHKQGRVALSKRFGGYYTYRELEEHYTASLREAHRVLKPKGRLVFKCQDIIHNHRMHCTHNMVINRAAENRLRLLDLFVLAARHRMPGPQKGTQRHARVWHSYFLVFEKEAAP